MTAWTRVWTLLLGFLRPEAERQRDGIRRRHEELADAARRKAEQKGLIYDAYPTPQNERPRVRIVLLAKEAGVSIMEPVNLDGYSLRELDLKSWRGKWVLERIEIHHKIIKARLALKHRENAAKRAEAERERLAKLEREFEEAVSREHAEAARASRSTRSSSRSSRSLPSSPSSSSEER